MQEVIIVIKESEFDNFILNLIPTNRKEFLKLCKKAWIRYRKSEQYLMIHWKKIEIDKYKSFDLLQYYLDRIDKNNFIQIILDGDDLEKKGKLKDKWFGVRVFPVIKYYSTKNSDKYEIGDYDD